MKPISRKLLVVAGCAALVSAVDVGTSHAVTAQSTTTGIVVVPLTIEKVLDLNFGKFMSGTGAAAGTVVVSTADGQTVTGGVTTTPGLGATASSLSVLL